jgi:F-type H+-transporting ATPase subunit epsilon
MAEKVQFELVSPEKLLTSAPVDMVVVPGGEGDFGVLPGHAPMIVSVRPGVIEIHENDRVIGRVFVAGGFAEVTATRCTVLAEEAVPVDELDPAALEQAARDAAEDVDDAKTDAERAAAETKLAIAHAKMDAARGALH